MQEQTRVVSTEELLQHLLGLAGTALDIDRPENGDDVLEQELGIARPPRWRTPFSGVIRGGVEERKDAQLAADPEPCSRLQLRVAREEFRSEGLEARHAVAADVTGEELVAIDVLAPEKSFVWGWSGAMWSAMRSLMAVEARSVSLGISGPGGVRMDWFGRFNGRDGIAKKVFR